MEAEIIPVVEFDGEEWIGGIRRGGMDRRNSTGKKG